MQIVIDRILLEPALGELQSALARACFEDGRSTAGWSAALVKHNEQAIADPEIDMWRERIAQALAANPVFHLAAQPKRIIGPMFSRHVAGDAYGAHIDEPILDGTRADLAFTLFLSTPESCDGGELVIDAAGGEDAHKHAAGSLVLYPATTLHRVARVTRGTRLAAVGWVRSFVRQASRRELIFDLETARQRLFESHGKTHEFDLLSKCSANLMRMWVDD